MNNFQVNQDGTVNIHYDGLNPSDVLTLINLMEGNLQFLMMQHSSPLDVFQRSARLNRIIKELSFQFSWTGPVHRVDLDDPNPVPPTPEVELTKEEHTQYLEIFYSMIQ